ncbi:hypothetical protein JNB_03200 [Janibacter sp. HTCC2649]|nr:hypothetical protein JNB_03200 [Janibacter sp. HTCC2649]
MTLPFRAVVFDGLCQVNEPMKHNDPMEHISTTASGRKQ